MSNDVVAVPSNAIVDELLNKDNYIKWSSLVQTYLIAQDLWDIVEPPTQNFAIKPPKPARQPEDTSKRSDNQSSSEKSDSDSENNSKPALIDQSPKADQDDTHGIISGETANPKDSTDHYEHNRVMSLRRKSSHPKTQDAQLSNSFDPIKAEEESKAWKKKNARALHAIKISCGTEAQWVIVHAEFAQMAWKILEMKFKPLHLMQLSDLPNQWNDHILPEYDSFYKSIVIGDWDAAEAFLKDYPDAVRAKINPFEESAIHVAATYGHTRIVEELVKRMTDKDLEMQTIKGYTALSVAAMIGIIPMAKCLVERHNKLTSIPSNFNELPVFLAIAVGHFDMARYLYPITKLDDLIKPSVSAGASLLAQCILSKNFDIALDLIKRCRELTIAQSMNTLPSPIILAMCKFSFPSGTPLTCWQRLIYQCIHIPSSFATGNISGDSDSADTQISIPGEPNKNHPTTHARPMEKKTSIVSGFLRTGSYFSDFLGIKQIYELKLLHFQSQEFLRRTMENLRSLRSEKRDLVNHIVNQALLKAVEEGNVEFVMELSKAIPETIRTLDHRLRSVFSYAVECRQAEIFNLIHGFKIVKEEIAAFMDDSGNTVLHMAGKLAPSSYLSHISGAALQMQRELQWFKEVESIMQHKLVQKEFYKNAKNMTPREYFTENHKELANEGEKWMKETATNCTFVSALIVTIMFAAAFIVPGGTEGEKKLKVISHEKWFLLYIISDAISLFSSTTSVLMFLGILTSRYYEDAFLVSLPTKLIIGLSTLFFSIATMMLVFCSALYTMLEGQLTVLIPVILLASVPVSLFVKLQFPLLVEIFVSTYGKGIFAERNDNWLFQK